MIRHTHILRNGNGGVLSVQTWLEQSPRKKKKKTQKRKKK